MPLARTLMIQGTASTVGKSTLVTGLCRIFAQTGVRVAPFKAQNMALNSFVTREGGEMGRAQVVQAEAAGITPHVTMNPVLLKPEGASRSQVIVMGRPVATMEAQAYYRNRTGLLEVVRDALTTLRTEYELVIIEGAGSPVELNLAKNDIVNMQVARLADAPVLLVGDIDRGGIFASLLGTLMLLPLEDRERVAGLIVNKFRGDIALWRDGEHLLAERSGVPVLGTLPMFRDIRIAEEDSVPLEEGTSSILHPAQSARGPLLEIVVIRLPYLSNYDEFDALAAEPGVRLHFVSRPESLPPSPDLLIIPGSKNTLADLGWLWECGLATTIRHRSQAGMAVFGICGGYQMLGERVIDPVGSESLPGTAEPGLGLLPLETHFGALGGKVTTQNVARIRPNARHGLFALLDDSAFTAYQIHVGRTVVYGSDGVTPFALAKNEVDGWMRADGWCAGAYLHGLFENTGFRQGVLAALARRRPVPPVDTGEHLAFNRQDEYEKLAAVLRAHLDIAAITRICGLSG